METQTETQKTLNMREVASSTQKPKVANLASLTSNKIGKKCTFPDLTAFPIHAIFDVNAASTLVCYYNEETPQIVWVPNEFISND